MGGGANSSPPVDVAPGGGTYPTNIFGEAYNPDWGSGNDLYSGIGSALSKGLNVYGSALEQGASHNYMTGAGTYARPDIPGAATQQNYVGTPVGSMIPGGGQSLDLEAILRLLKGLG